MQQIAKKPARVGHHSPQRSPGKFTLNLLNISNKFTGTGGSNNHNWTLDSSSLAPKKLKQPAKVPKTDIFAAQKYKIIPMV